MLPKLNLQLLEGSYNVTLLPASSPLPDWIKGPGFKNVSFCEDELSIVCPSERVPPDVKSDEGWSAIKLTSSFDFDETGVVLSVVEPLSSNKLGVFVVSTFHRDYLLVKQRDLSMAKALLESAGHRFVEPPVS